MRKLCCISALLLCLTFSYAQDRQQPLMSGIYGMYPRETPLYYIPQTVFKPLHSSVMHLQTTPFRTIQDWGTQYAIVSCDTVDRSTVNSIVFLNAQADTNIAAGFASWQTEPIHFQEMDSNILLRPTYGNNSLERQQNGTFNFQSNWFSVYGHLQIKTSSWKDTQDENRSIEGTMLTVESAAFDLFRSIPIKSVIYNNTADSIPLYPRTDTLSSPQDWFPLNENLFVYKDSLDGQWLKVSRFELLPGERYLIASEEQAHHNRFKETTGWVQKEDLYRKQWEKHLAELPDFRFEVVGVDLNAGDEYYTRGMLAAIKVVDKKSDQTVQVISDIGAEITDTLNQCLRFVDANFDGYPDIVSAYADGGSGPNYTNIFYLFDPVSKRFVYNEDLSVLSQVEVDTTHQVIRSAWRAGAGQHGAAEYRFIDGRMEQTYQWDQVWGWGYFVEEAEAVRQPDGQWKETLIYSAEAVTDTVTIYRKPDKGQTSIARVPGATAYFRIRDEKPLWYYVQTDYPDSLQGWIQKETVFPSNWKVLPVPLSTFEFEKVEDEYGNLLALRIKDKKSGKPVQIIGPVDNRYRSGILETEDYNGDGQMDFRIRWTNEETEPVVYLFDKRKKLFVKADNIGM